MASARECASDVKFADPALRILNLSYHPPVHYI